jgi:uncharacterized membrane protein
MEAGAALSDNLFSAWLIILLYQHAGGTIGWAVNLGTWNSTILWLISGTLLITMWTRRAAFIVREDRIVCQLDPDGTGGVPE